PAGPVALLNRSMPPVVHSTGRRPTATCPSIRVVYPVIRPRIPAERTWATSSTCGTHVPSTRMVGPLFRSQPREDARFGCGTGRPGEINADRKDHARQAFTLPYEDRASQLRSWKFPRGVSDCGICAHDWNARWDGPDHHRNCQQRPEQDG